MADTRFISISVDPPEVQAAFRAGIGARWTFLSDAERRWIDELGLMETTDSAHLDAPMTGRSRIQNTGGREMRTGDVAGAVGRGLAAGMAGTALMTLSSTIEMKVQGREASSAPADAAAKVLGVEPKGDTEKARFSTVVHWAYGTSWGALRGVLGAAGLRGPAAGGAHFVAVWGSGLVMLPALGVAPPLREWGVKALATDAFHHLVYAAGTSLAFRALDRS